MAQHRVVSLLVLGALIAWGCALSTHGLPADTSGAGGAGAGTSQSSTATTSSEASTAATSTSGATTTSSTASTTTSSTAATTSSTVTTTTTTTSSTTTSTTSGGGPCMPGMTNVCCGMTACGIPPNKCCFDQGTQDNSTCVPANQLCSGGTFEMRCDAGEDCPGTNKVCCGAWDGGKYTSMTCTDASMCNPPGVLGLAGNYPSCNYPGGTCPGTLHCYSATSLSGTHGYCF